MRRAILGSMAASEHVFDPSALEGPSGPGPSSAGDGEAEPGLRPASLADFVGQQRIVDDLKVAIGAAQGRDEPPDHVLFSGPPGLGKTSLARILAGELGTQLHSSSGPALERPRDLVGILTQLTRGDVLFIDEVHRVPAAVEEYLYTAMEDFSIDFTLDTGPHARILPLTIQPFTLVGATTREGMLSAPFRARFGLFERLDPYPTEDLVKIVQRSARILNLTIDDAAATLLAERSRGTPRIVNRFLRRTRDLAQVRGSAHIELALADETLGRLGIDERGLEEMDRRILRCLAQAEGRPTGLKTIAAAVGETEDTIEEVFEPHLLRCGYLLKTARGRLITANGARLIGVDPGSLGAEQPGLFP